MSRLFTRTSSHLLSRDTNPAVSAYPFTIWSWVYPETIAGDHTILCLGSDVSASTSGFASINFGGAVAQGRVQIRRDDGGQSTHNSTELLTLDTWGTVGCTFDAAADRRLYVNGVKSTTTTNIIIPTSLVYTAVGARRIDSTPANDRHFDGRLALSTIWDVSLTDDEHTMLSKGIHPLLVRPQSIVRHYPIIGRTSPEIEIMGGFDLTVTGAVAEGHPPVINPAVSYFFTPAAAAPAAGDVTVAVVSAQLSTSGTGTTDFTKSGFGTPKACIIIMTEDEADGTTVSPQSRASIGFSDFTNHRCITHQNEDASAKVDSDALKSNTKAFVLCNVGGIVIIDGTAGTGVTDGVRLTNTTNTNADDPFVTVIMFGGADLQISLDTVVVNSTQDLSTVTTTSIDQDLVFLIGSDIAGEDSKTTGISNSFGVAHIDTSDHTTFVNRCIGFASDHNNNAGSPSAVIRNNRSLSMITETGGLDWGIELTAATTTSHTLTTRDAGAGANMEMYALALDLGDRASKVGSVDGPTSGATWDPTVSLTFTPQYVGLGLTDLTNENTIASDAEGGVTGISSNTGTGEETCHSWYDDDAAATIDTNNLFRSRAIDLRDDVATTVLQDHSHSAFDSTGWTYTINTINETVAKKWFYWAIEEKATADITRNPSKGNLILIASAPSVDIGIIPAQATLTLTPAVPSSIQDIALLPEKTNLVLTPKTPAVDINHFRFPSKADLTLAPAAPSLDTGFIPAQNTLSLSPVAPGLDTGIQPTQAILALTPATPSLDTGIIPTQAVLILTPKVPTVEESTGNIDRNPAKAILTLASIAPGLDTGIIPAQAVLAFAPVAPFLDTGISPAQAILTLTPSTPIAQEDHPQLPTGAVLTLTPATPSLDTGIIPAQGVLTFTTVAPNITVGIGRFPALANLVLTPATLSLGIGIIPAKAVLTLTPATPTITSKLEFFPAKADLTLATVAPLVAENFPKFPTKANLILTPGVPVRSESLFFNPAKGTLALVTVAPLRIEDFAKFPASANLTLTPAIPVRSEALFYNPPKANLVLAPVTPLVAVTTLLLPAKANLILSPVAPTFVATTSNFFFPAAARLTLTSFPPRGPLGWIEVPTDAATEIWVKITVPVIED